MKRLFLILIFSGSLMLILFFTVFRKQIEIPDYPQSVYFLAAGSSTRFFSVRGLSLHVEDILSYREKDLPWTGGANYFLHLIEYSGDQKFSGTDLIELAGEDISVQIKPFFLMITRSRREYGIFYRFKVQEDPVIRFRNISLSVREIRQTGDKLYYFFSGPYLFLSDDLKGLKRFLLQAGRIKLAVTPDFFPSVLIHDQGSQSVLPYLCGMGEPQIKSSNLSGKFYLSSKDDPGRLSDTNSIFYTRLDLSKLSGSGRPVWTELVVKKALIINNELRFHFVWILPADLHEKAMEQAREIFRAQALAPGQVLREIPYKDRLIFSNYDYEPSLQRTDLVLKAGLSSSDYEELRARYPLLGLLKDIEIHAYD